MARFLLLAGMTVNATADEAQVVATETTEEGVCVRTVRFTARLGPDDVLVVRSERREDDRVVLESEEIYGVSAAGEGATVRLRRFGPDGWQIHEAAAEQFLQGVTVAKWEVTPAALHLAFSPDPLRAQRRYALTWTATVENRATVKLRHPDLPPADSPAGRWPVRTIRLPAARAATEAGEP